MGGQGSWDGGLKSYSLAKAPIALMLHGRDGWKS